MEENICRLCLNLVKGDFEVIDVVTRQMMEVLSLKVDLDASENPILCQDCAELAKKSYFFKSACKDMEEIIFSCSTAKDRVEIDIKGVYEDSKGVLVVGDEDFSICRFCMNKTNRSYCVSLDDVMFAKILSGFMPEMVPNIIIDPVICTSCKKNLDHYFKFTHTCLDTEEKIIKYRQNEPTNSTSPIKLSNVLGFLFKNTVIYPEKYTQIPTIKQENLFEDIEHDADSKIHEERIKCEALDVKHEDDVSLKEAPSKSPSEVMTDKYEGCVLEKNDNNILKYETTYESTDGELHKCGICSHETRHKHHFKRHMLMHMDASEVEMYKCTMCTFETKYKDYLRTHLLMHKDASEVEMNKCGICKFETRYRNVLIKHMLIHKDASEIEMHKCGLCSFETKYKNNIKNHMLTHKHPSEVEMLKCESCTYETKHKDRFKKHILIHKNPLGTEMYKCEMCTYETIHKNYLRKHTRIHRSTAEVETHKCEICTYETIHKNYLQKHLRSHKRLTEIETHKCTICTHETKFKDKLKTHMLVHKDLSEVEMHKCGKCTYETKHKSSLTRHVQIKHSSEIVMYKCGICDCETKYKTSLKKHMLTHRGASEVEMYKCEICTYETKYKYALKPHMLKHKESLGVEEINMEAKQ